MAATPFEIARLAIDITSDHKEIVVSIACLVHMTRTMFREFAKQHGANLEPLLRLQCSVLREYVSYHDIAEADVTRALRALERAGTTAGYLQSLPE